MAKAPKQDLDEIRDLATVSAVTKIVGDVPDKWKGRCFEIASIVANSGLLPEAVAVFGHWTGLIQPQSFFSDRRNLGWTNHGWIVLPGGIVVDPTRWVFENAQPYIFVGQHDEGSECVDFEAAEDEVTCVHCDHVVEEHAKGGLFRPCRLCAWPYDEGGNKVRAAFQRPPPDLKHPRQQGGKRVRLSALLGEPLAFARVLLIHQLLPSDPQAFTLDQVAWLANAPYDTLGQHVGPIYAAIKRAGYGAHVPMDNMARALRESPAGAAFASTCCPDGCGPTPCGDCKPKGGSVKLKPKGNKRPKLG